MLGYSANLFQNLKNEPKAQFFPSPKSQNYLDWRNFEKYVIINNGLKIFPPIINISLMPALRSEKILSDDQNLSNSFLD